MTSCQVIGRKPYAPPPRLAQVEDVEVVVREFAGRPEANAIVKGHLSSTAAQLVDSRQSREGELLIVEVMEQTPHGATPTPLADAVVAATPEDTTPSFETVIPIEILGLDPGPHLLRVNGLEIPFEIPTPRATLVSSDDSQPHSPITLVDEFILPSPASQ